MLTCTEPDPVRIRPFCTLLIACLLCGPGLIASRVEGAVGHGQYRNAVASGQSPSSNNDPVSAQQSKDKWERVYTAEDSIVEINTSSLSFRPDHILRVQFRTIFSKALPLPGASDTKYKTQLEIIDFKLNEARYRISETTLLDSSGKELQWYSTSQMREWRVLKSGGVTEKLFKAARAQPPFGIWKVVAYQFAEGDSNEPKPSELEKLIGVRVNLQSHRAEVGDEICTSPAFEDKRSSDEELFRELKASLKTIGVQPESVEMITISCKGSGWQPPQSLLVKVREGEMLMLWEGVFLVLKR